MIPGVGTCWTSVYTGQLCKHGAAYNLSHVRLGSSVDEETAACNSIRDIGSGLRDREHRVPKDMQVTEVLGKNTCNVQSSRSS